MTKRGTSSRKSCQKKRLPRGRQKRRRSGNQKRRNRWAVPAWVQKARDRRRRGCCLLVVPRFQWLRALASTVGAAQTPPVDRQKLKPRSPKKRGLEMCSRPQKRRRTGTSRKPPASPRHQTRTKPLSLRLAQKSKFGARLQSEISEPQPLLRLGLHGPALA